VSRLKGLLWPALVAAALDQAAKLWLAAKLPPGGRIRLAPFLDLVHVRNPGVAFGVFSGTRPEWLLLALTFLGWLVLFGLAIWFSPRGRRSHLALGLALGGAAGNLIDRLRFRGVVDFLDFHWGRLHWPAFNLADASLCVGFALLVWLWFQQSEKN